MSDPTIHVFSLGPFETNCFVITAGDPQSRACWIVDCGIDPEPLLDFVAERELTPTKLLLTHTHYDHIGGLDKARVRFRDLPVYVHEAEQGFCSDPMKNLSAIGGFPVSVSEPDHTLHDGEELDLAGTTWRIMHTPGHSPGGVCFIHEPSEQAIVGDTLFAGSMGRIDFPTSDPVEMKTTLTERLMSLPDAMVIYPGHGPDTTIGHERATNPFLLDTNW